MNTSTEMTFFDGSDGAEQPVSSNSMLRRWKCRARLYHGVKVEDLEIEEVDGIPIG